MPCYDPQAAADNEHNSHLAAIVCNMFRMTPPGQDVKVTETLRRWYKAHEERDRQYGIR